MLYSLIRPWLFCLDAEKSHYLALRLLKLTTPWWRWRNLPASSQHPVKIMGLTFPNPVGLAAGFDKNGDYLPALQTLGFGFIELGTVTPQPQAGNPKPRLFRLPLACAIINRMGFNNSGVEHLVRRLQQPRAPGVIVGANIGKNRQTTLENAAQDYDYCLRKVYPWVDYVTINISSPNSPGLRRLQSSGYLNQLLSVLDNTQQELVQTYGNKKPLLIKIDPDMNDAELTELVSVILNHQIDGVIATNTTVNRNMVAQFPHGHEEGGLSGVPLFQRSTQVVHKLTELLSGRLPIIAVGGIFTVEDVQEKLAAGASLVQIYSGLIYQGPGVIRKIIKKMGR